MSEDFNTMFIMLAIATVAGLVVFLFFKRKSAKELQEFEEKQKQGKTNKN